MNKLFTKIAAFSVGLAMAVGVGVAVGSRDSGVREAKASTKDGSWTLTSSSGDWTATDCVTYFSQPYGMKKANAKIVSKSISDFATSGITKFKIGVKSLQNGGTTSILTVSLLNSSGTAVCSDTITPVNASAASSTTYKYVEFTSGFTGADKIQIQCTTFGKNVLINGASYEVTYNSGPEISVASSLSVYKDAKATLSVTFSNLTNDISVTQASAESTSGAVSLCLTENGTYTDSLTIPKATSSPATVYVKGVALGKANLTFATTGVATSPTCLVTITEEPSEVGITYNSYKDNLPASGYSSVDWSANSVSGKIYTIKNNDSNIQFQADTSYVYNTLAISGYITNITIAKASGSYSKLTAFVGNSDGGAITEKPASGGIDNNTNWTWSFDAEDQYCYFRIDSTSSGAKYFTSINVAYEKVQKVDPTGIVLDDDSPISMDTYSYGRRRLTATVEPFNNNDPSVHWGTSDDSVVTVSDGILTAEGVGNAIVYATTGNYVDDETTPDLKVSVSVSVSQALYTKATFVPSSASAATQADDYLPGGSVSLTSTGSYSNDKKALQLASTKTATFTISGYAGMKVIGIDLVMSSNGNAGSGSLTVTAGSTEVYEIETATFEDSSWNGAYDALPCDIYKDSTDYLVSGSQTIVFSFAATVNSLYIHSIAIRYLDNSLELWCTNFLAQITCDGGDPGAITDDSNWGTLSTAFGALSENARNIAAGAKADKTSESVIEQAMARYDLILRKYGIGTGAGQHTDFIGRFGVGKINGPLKPTITILGDNDSTGTISAIIVISVVSIAALGGYFFLRRRKEQ